MPPTTVSSSSLALDTAADDNGGNEIGEMEVFELGDEGGTLGSLGDLLRQLKGLKGSKNESFEEIESLLEEVVTSYPTSIQSILTTMSTTTGTITDGTKKAEETTKIPLNRLNTENVTETSLPVSLSTPSKIRNDSIFSGNDSFLEGQHDTNNQPSSFKPLQSCLISTIIALLIIII